ncbi:MAG TPA: AI-2E family transporter, partial [Sedimentisphaerales bacterium]|nr:AI-2E family transporter [Sedimentisphaerales bacterium]
TPATPKTEEPAPAKPGPLVLYPLVDEADRTATLAAQPSTASVVDEVNEPNAPAAIEQRLPKKTPRIDTQQIVKDLKNYIFNIVTNGFGTILGLISSMLFVIIFVLFLLMGRNPYTTHSQVYSEVVGKIRKYVGIKIVISAVTGTMVWVILTLAGLKLATVFGILAFLLNFIPSIGSIIVTFLPLPIAVVQFQSSPWMIVLVIAVPGVLQNILGNIIEPKLQGEGLNLHPVTILLALSFWGLLWGIVGMFLAAPITAAIRIMLMQFDMFRPIARLMAGDFTEPPPSIPREETRSDAPLPE